MCLQLKIVCSNREHKNTLYSLTKNRGNIISPCLMSLMCVSFLAANTFCSYISYVLNIFLSDIKSPNASEIAYKGSNKTFNKGAKLYKLNDFLNYISTLKSELNKEGIYCRKCS